MQRVGQVPIDVRREIDGFILNRLQGALLTEALRLVQDGIVSPRDLDKTVADGLGLRWSFMGPFETIELNAPGGVADYCARYVPWFRRYVADLPTPQTCGTTRTGGARCRRHGGRPRATSELARRSALARRAAGRAGRAQARAEASTDP